MKIKNYVILFLFLMSISCLESDIKEIEDLKAMIEKLKSDLENVDVNKEDVIILLDSLKSRLEDLKQKIELETDISEEEASPFLSNYDGTIWADSENYYSDFSDIKFSNSEYFISFFNLAVDASYCEGWKKGETVYDGVKWNIDITKDEENVFWFDYDYYGFSEEIEYSITYKYEVIDGLLNFSSSNDQTFIFNPSERNYSKDFIDTGEIIELEGCSFY